MTPMSKRLNVKNNGMKDFNGKSLPVTQVDVIKCPADNMEFAVSVVNDLTIDQLTVTNGINVQNTLYTVTDVAQTLKEMSDTLSALETKINNSGTPTFTARITSK